MKLKITSLLLCLGTMIFSSCSEEYKEEVNRNNTTLEITTGIQTRSIIESNSFSIGDQIGMFVLNTDNKEYAEGSSNIEATYDTKWYIATQLTLKEQEATIYAYYPYNVKKNSFKQISVDIYPYADQNGQTDFLYGIGTADVSSPKATITFKHATARVTFLIKRKAEDVGNGVLTKVSLRNAIGSKAISTMGTIDITTGQITPYLSESSSIVLSTNYTLSNSTEQKVDLLVIPTEIKENAAELALTIDGALYVVKIPATTWEKGQQYTYPITIDRTDAHMGENTKAQIGDYYYDDGSWSTEYNKNKNCLGIVFALSDEKDGDINVSLNSSEHGRIVALKDLEGTYSWAKEYLDIEKIPNCNYIDGYYTSGYLPIDGNNNYQPGTEKEHIPKWNLINWPAVNGKDYAFTDYKGKQHTSNLRNENYPAAIACDPSGAGFWYLPSLGEMARLGMAYGAKLIDNSKQNIFTNFKGLDYWSSSEYDSEMGWRYRPYDANVGIYNKKSKLYVRPIASF